MVILQYIGTVFVILKLFKLNEVAMGLSWFWLLLIPLWYILPFIAALIVIDE